MRTLVLLFALMACKDNADDSGVLDADNDGVVAADDCDDNDPSAYPGATEACDGVDNDCNGAVDDSVGDLWYEDLDGDGFGDPASSQQTCEGAQGWVADNTDCDDLAAAVNPDATEACDEIDNDCDTQIDEDVLSTWYTDADQDGHGDPNSPVSACSQPAGTSASDQDCDDSDPLVSPNGVEVCDGADNDCNGVVDDDAVGATRWYADSDSDGFGDLLTSEAACEAPEGFVADATDCDDSDGAVNPDAAEVCNGVDDDCNNQIDEAGASGGTVWYRDGDLDGYGDPGSPQTSCTQPTGYVADATDCNDRNATINPGATELCNGVDDNCDALLDDGSAADADLWYLDGDRDGYGDPGSSQRACSQPSSYVADATDCDDSSAAIFPGATELCNGLDDNCDSAIDESTAADALTWYLDADSDGYGNSTSTLAACNQPGSYVADSTDCDDGSAAVSPGATELCNGVDDNCDAVVDESTAADASTWYLDADSDGYGDPNSSTRACSQPTRYLSDDNDCDDNDNQVNPLATEYCDTIDNNCDGVVDEDSAADAEIWYLDSDSDGYGTSASTTLACEQPSGYADNADDCDDSDPQRRYCQCTLSSVGTATSLVSSGSTYGAWLVDPLETLGAGLIWEMDSYNNQTSLVRFPSQSAMVARTGSTTITLPYGWDGTGGAVYDGYLYYNKANSDVVIKYDLLNQAVVGQLTLPGAGYHNTYYYQWGGYSDIDMAVDEQGLWALYGTSANGGKMVVSKIDDVSFTITATYNTSSATKRTIGNAFMVCGVLYATSSYSSSSATISYSYDTATGVSSSSISIPMGVANGYLTQLSYNPTTGIINAWDNRYRVTYTTVVTN